MNIPTHQVVMSKIKNRIYLILMCDHLTLSIKPFNLGKFRDV